MPKADNLTTFLCRLSWNLGASTSWSPQGLCRRVMGLLYRLPFYLKFDIEVTFRCLRHTAPVSTFLESEFQPHRILRTLSFIWRLLSSVLRLYWSRCLCDISYSGKRNKILTYLPKLCSVSKPASHELRTSMYPASYVKTQTAVCNDSRP
jgi:hypothetical protein